MFSGDSPPRGVQLPQGYKFLQRKSPVVIEQNVSYTRSDQQAGPSDKTQSFNNVEPGRRLLLFLDNSNTGNGSNGSADGSGTSLATAGVSSHLRSQSQQQNGSEQQNNQTDEDAQFLRLAHDALVATSKGGNLIVDPTIQDLLRRLQYALSPHGNPIKRLESIQANENGQLMIQSFYNGFPNMSNDIFTGSNNPSNADNPGWNFLIDKKQSASESPEPGDSPDELGGLGRKNERKFPCTSCTMSFRRSSDLKRHEKQHLSIPANICPQCGKGFARKDALKRHLGTLTCKRNADKKLYHKNLRYLKDQDHWDE